VDAVTPELETVLAAAEARGYEVIRNGQEPRATCPAHDDQHPSLRLKDGKFAVLAWCDVCQRKDIAERAADAFGVPLAEWFYDKPRKVRVEPVAVYPYRDEGGRLLYEKCRYPSNHQPPFSFRRPGGEPGHGDKFVLYRLPEVKAAGGHGVIYVVEGEKDVEAIERAGGAATCNPLGASKGQSKWRPEFSQWSGPCLADTSELAPLAVLLVVLDRGHGLELRG
jgi:putative DNA primase/helicase